LCPKSKRAISKNRCRLDIVREVLSIASVKVRKTRIMYGANLNFLQVEKYLSVLLGSGLLEHDGEFGYLTTGTGLEFLQLYEDFRKRSERLEAEVEKNIMNKCRLETLCFKNNNGKPIWSKS
jgi:predicted transcriptional regulator